MTAGDCFLAGRIVPLLFIIAGIIVAFLVHHDAVLGARSVNWPTAEGTMRAKDAYYEFTVDGRKHYGDRVAFDFWAGEESSGFHSKKHTVTVHYMPGNPDVCVLKPGRMAKYWRGMVLAIVFVGAGVAMAVLTTLFYRGVIGLASDGDSSGGGCVVSGCVVYLLVPILAIAGSFFLYCGAREMLRDRETKNWPTAQGVIQESSLAVNPFAAKIGYKFVVNDKSYVGHRVARGELWDAHPAGPGAVVSKYPAGQAVTVHYMPGNPDECVLEPGIGRNAWNTLWFGLLIIGAAGVIVVWSLFYEDLARLDPTISKDI